MMETSIYIRNLRLHARHGVLSQERTVGNDYIVNITVGYPWAEAARTDDVRETLNYAALAEVVKREMDIPSDLIETVAARIAEAVKRDFPKVTAMHLDVRKLAPPMPYDTDGCGVTVDVRY